MRINNKRALVLLGVPAIGLAMAGIAFAANVTLTSSQLGAGTATVAQCEGAGTITSSYVPPGQTGADISDTGNGYQLNSVTLSGITLTGTAPVGCQGKTLYVTVVDGSHNVLGSGSAVISTVSQQFTLTPKAGTTFIPASSVAQVDILIPN